MFRSKTSLNNAIKKEIAMAFDNFEVLKTQGVEVINELASSNRFHPKDITEGRKLLEKKIKEVETNLTKALEDPTFENRDNARNSYDMLHNYISRLDEGLLIQKGAVALDSQDIQLSADATFIKGEKIIDALESEYKKTEIDVFRKTLRERSRAITELLVEKNIIFSMDKDVIEKATRLYKYVESLHKLLPKKAAIDTASIEKSLHKGKKDLDKVVLLKDVIPLKEVIDTLQKKGKEATLPSIRESKDEDDQHHNERSSSSKLK